jgi:hypothetical protein
MYLLVLVTQLLMNKLVQRVFISVSVRYFQRNNWRSDYWLVLVLTRIILDRHTSYNVNDLKAPSIAINMWGYI